MQFHNLKRVHKNKSARQVGRGGKRGKTSGRGTKGQKARAGRKLRPELRDIIKKIPKLRGRGTNTLKSIKSKPIAVNIKTLEANFAPGETVSPETLIKKGLIFKGKGNLLTVKILGDGEITKALTISGCLISAQARLKIEKVKGKVV